MKNTSLKTLLVTVFFANFAFGETDKDKWEPIFNGKDLKDWTIKMTGYEVGVNFNNTFRVEDGLLKVTYADYDEFNKEFGHLFYKEKLTNYRIRMEYRFVGEQVKKGPKWAFRNSGIMLHCQSPETMRVDQEFPVSIEAQTLGSVEGGEARPCGSVCTPGTHIIMDDKLVKRHCIGSSSGGCFGDEWVILEVIVDRGSFKHFVNGELVMEYSDAVLDESDPDAAKLIEAGDSVERTAGYIAIQSESHSLDIRKIEILRLE